MTKFNRYKQNLTVDGCFVISYSTVVATIDFPNNTIQALGYWSKTTTKHINYVAAEFGLKKV